jgi:hypothetical protein
MAIFDNVRGLVPLPKSRSGSASQASSNVASGQGFRNDPEVLSDSVPIPLPNFNKTDVGNTFIDRTYSQINDVFRFLTLPTPSVINDVFKFTQGIEEIVSDPNTFIRQTVEKGVRSFTKGIKESLMKNSEAYVMDGKGNPIVSLPESNYPPGNPKLETRDGGKKDDKYVGANDYHLDRSFLGWESVKDLTIRSTDLWDLKVEPFHYSVPNIWVPEILSEEMKEVNTPVGTSKNNKYLEKGKLNTSGGNSDFSNTHFIDSMYPKPSKGNLKDFIPILSYDLDLKTLGTKEILLFGGSSISVPDTIRYTSKLSFQLADDENKRWRRWFQKYSENLYEEKTTGVAPYKNSSLLVSLYQYRPDFKVLSHNQFICSLNNYRVSSTGSGSSGLDTLDIELSIVGKVDLDPNYSYLQII